MTVNSTTNKTIALGNGATTEFAFNFIGVAATYISVIYTDASGNQTALTPSQYGIALNSPPAGAIWGLGGIVTYPLMGSPIASGTTLTIYRSLPLVQGISLANQASYGQYAKSAEQADDLIEMQLQQTAELDSRAIVTPIVDAVPPIPLPPAAQRAGQALIFDSTGQPTVGSIPSGGVISAAMAPVVSAATLAAGRAAFGLGAAATEGIGAGLQDDGAGNIRVDFVISSVATNQAIGSAAHCTQFIATGPITFTHARASTLWNGFQYEVYATIGPVTLVFDSHDAVLGSPSNSIYTIPAGTSAFVSTNGASTGTWLILGNDRTQWFSVVAFGADPSNQTTTAALLAKADCTASVQAAINACHAGGGGTVYFPPGTYIHKLQASYANPVIDTYDDVILDFGSALVLSQAAPGGSWANGYCLYRNADYSGGGGGNKNITVRGGRFKAAAPAVYPTGTFTNGNAVITGVSSTAGVYQGMGIFGTGSQGGGTGGGSLVSAVISFTSNTITMSLPANANSTNQFFCGWSGGPFFDFNHTDNLTMDGVTMLDTYSSGPLVAINVLAPSARVAVTNSRLNNLTFGFDDPPLPDASYYSAGSGLVIRGGSTNINGNNWNGETGDDFFALNVEADQDNIITGINITNLNGTSKWGQLRLLAGVGTSIGTVTNINMTNIIFTPNNGGVNTGAYGLTIQDASGRTESVRGVDITNLQMDCQHLGTNLVGMESAGQGVYIKNASDVTINTVSSFSPKTNHVYIFASDRITINGLSAISANRTAVPSVLVDGGSGEIYFDHARVAASLGAGIQYNDVAGGGITNTSLQSNAGNGVALTGTTDHINLTGNRAGSNGGNSFQEYNAADFNIFIANDSSLNSGGITKIGANSIAPAGSNI